MSVLILLLLVCCVNLAIARFLALRLFMGRTLFGSPCVSTLLYVSLVYQALVHAMCRLYVGDEFAFAVS